MNKTIYQFHKKVMATPMNWVEYNEYRDWELPYDGYNTKEGYLVEYLDGSKPNHPDHKGRIVWLPKEEFDAGYTAITDGNNKVPPSRIEDLLSKLEYKFARVDGTTVTACWSFLPNGFSVGYGESACVDAANYDQELGEKYALERCKQASKDKLWELEGYVLSQTVNPV